MNVSKFVMLLLEALLKLVIDSAKCYEESSNVDAAGSSDVINTMS